ncbi:NAD-dependent epimerase/dehydratase family protein [Zunongwangia sp. H14]|uniref:NAD-dependent epimerase/dehydratase family protein n=1 Tax=Zunongwangia sp. H14 TaxID=3240792 RepID=UPI00356591BA
MILVTGGTGLVGSHLLFDLSRSQKKIRAIYRKTSDLHAVEKVFSYYTSTSEAKALFSKIEWRVADIQDVPALSRAFEEVEYVYHCAALVSFDPKDAKKLRQNNIAGTANIVNLCIANSIKKLCHVSSTASMGKPLEGNNITEATTWNPEEDHSDYAISKYGAEIEVWRGTQEGVDAVIVNPGVIIGPGFWNSGSGLLFKKVYKGFKYHFPKITAFVGVKDVVKAMQHLMASEIKNEQFILVSENLSFKTVLSLTAESLQKKPPSRALKKWMVFAGWMLQSLGSIFGFKKQLTRDSVYSLFDEWHFSNRKIKQYLDFQFSPVADCIAETAEIYQSKIDA